MRVIDCHAHLQGLQEVEEKRGLWDSLGYERVCLSADGGEALELARRYPDYVLPFYRLDLDREGPEDVERVRLEGFVGLEFTGPNHRYCYDRYLPVYEQAVALDMPALFHTGFLSFAHRPYVRQDALQPCYLITLASRFPRLRMVGTHLGNQWAMEAVTAMASCENLWFDMSGETIRYCPADWFRWLLGRVERNQTGQPVKIDLSLVGKLVFGSDNADDTMDFYRNFMEAMAIPLDVQQKVYYENAVAWLGL